MKKFKSVLAFVLIVSTLACVMSVGAYADGEAVPTALRINTPPTKAEYILGDTLDLTGLDVCLVMSDETTSPVEESELQVSGFDSDTVGQKTVTLSYDTLSDSFTVTVSEPVASVSTWADLQQALAAGGKIVLAADVICDDQALGPQVVPSGVTASLDLNGFKVDRNLTSAVSNGQVITVYDTLTVSDSVGGGKITGGYSNGNGNGGVYVRNGGTFNMTDGSVSGNTAYSGGGVYVYGGTFNMSGGSVSGNSSSNDDGGGVYVYNGGTFNMSGGSVSGNTAYYAGGGVYVYGGTFTLSGGSVSGNSGSGVYLANSSYSVLELGGDAVISGNTGSDSSVSNLYLSNGNILSILGGDDAPDDMSVGISSAAAPTASAPVTAAQSGMADAYLKNFSSDNSAYTLKRDGEKLVLALSTPATYTVTFDANGGSNAPDPQSVASGGKLSWPNAPTRTGYDFYGWFREAACTNEWNFDTDTVTGNITLYAKWKQLYIVHYNSNGGSSVADSNYTSNLPATLPTPTKSGMTFAGWFTDEALTTAAVPGAVLSADTTLYAKWTQAAYQIVKGAHAVWYKYSADGQLFTSDAPFAKFDSVTVDGNTVSSDNYTASEGSTDVTLKPAYLNSLALGKHDLTVKSSDGNASTDFEIKPCRHLHTELRNKKEATCSAKGYTGDTYCTDCGEKIKTGKDIARLAHVDENKDKICDVCGHDMTKPDTGDSTSLALLASLAAFSALGLGTVCSGLRKRKENF